MRTSKRKKPAASAATTQTQIADPATTVNPESPGGEMPQTAAEHSGSANRPGGQAQARHVTGSGETRKRNRSRSASGSSQKRGRGRPPLSGSARRPGATETMPAEVRHGDGNATAVMNSASAESALGLPPFHFRAAAWNGVESIEDYETRVLSHVQQAFGMYANYCKAVATASGSLAR